MKLVFFLLTFVSLSVSASPVTSWIRLGSRLRWELDGQQKCDQLYFQARPIYLTLFTENGRLTGAVFRSWKFTAVPSQQLWLTPEELKGVVWVTDRRGRPWLERLSLDARELAWMFFYFNTDLDGCRLGNMATLGPNRVTLNFELEGVKAGIFVSYSDRHAFRGMRYDRHRFDVKEFSIVQSMPDEIELYDFRRAGY